MGEDHEILLSSIEQSGISLPKGVSSILEVSPGDLLSICSQSLNLIDSSICFPAPLPISTAESVKVCTQIASSIKSLGYRGNLSFRQLLYPSGEDTYNLVRFLAERLSRSSESIQLDGEREVISGSRNNKTFSDVMGDPLRSWTNSVGDHDVDGKGHTVLDICSSSRSSGLGSDNERNVASRIICQSEANSSIAPLHSNFDNHKHANVRLSGPLVATGKNEPSKDACSVAEHVDRLPSNEPMDQETMHPFEQNHIFPKEGYLESEAKLPEEGEETNSQVPLRRLFETHRGERCIGLIAHKNADTGLGIESTDKCSALDSQDVKKHSTSRAYAEMKLKHQHPKFGERPEAKENSLSELQSEWCAFLLTMEETKAKFVLSGDAKLSEAQEKLGQLDEVSQETADIISDILKRDEELYKLSVKLEKQAKMTPRSYYIQRITELTKNGWKQDADIKQIMEATRELQMEINSVQESLKRTYTLVDDILFRDAKRDATGSHAYRLLTSIHENFSQISDTILSIDRARREASDYETRLGSLSSRYGGIGKLQADLDSMQQENEQLKKQIQN